MAIGRADDEWREAVAAIVVLRDGATADAQDLRRQCRLTLAD